MWTEEELTAILNIAVAKLAEEKPGVPEGELRVALLEDDEAAWFGPALDEYIRQSIVELRKTRYPKGSC